ncbi:MAG: FliH/SctL family protein [Proteobacteria bacterium]|nr:FliH/SctL family protein [Pseudomonadota bacterium]
MKGLFEMVKPFTLNNFVDKYESKDGSHEFVSFFNNSNNPTSLDIELQQMQDNAADIENEARKVFEDAYIQGEKSGYEMGMKKVEPLVKRLNGDIAALTLLKEELFKKAEKLSVELALVFAEGIVLKECHENREIVLNMARKALEICEEKSGITIRMRREDVQHISEDRIYPLKIVPDDTLKDPGFIIETNFGDIDGTIATQIEELKKEFCNGYADR